VLVTHDRYLLDALQPLVLGLDGQGGPQLCADYWQWEEAGQGPAKPEKKKEPPPKPAPAKRKLTYPGAREWEPNGASHPPQPSVELEPSAPKCTPPS